MTHVRDKHTWIILLLVFLIILLGTPLILALFQASRGDLVENPAQTTKPVPEAIIYPVASTTEVTTPETEKKLFTYIEVTDGCGTHFEDECLLVRSGPGTDFPIVSRLRSGIVLKVESTIEQDGILWYKIIFDEWLRYPERVKGDWYVAASFVTAFTDEGELELTKNTPTTTPTKKIVVSRSEQKLYAYDGETVFMEIPISTGLELTPTPRGTFTVFRKTPSRYMQGPLPGLADQQSYDLPGVPWNLYFTSGGAVIHGAYWHNKFGTKYSHGCVNLSLADARKLYYWAPVGTQVVVKD